MDTKKRQELRQELVGAGYAWDMIDNWQAKTTLYWHINKLNASGDIGFKKGTAIPNVPGNPEYLKKMAYNGAYAYPVTDDCECRHCLNAKSQIKINKEEVEDVTIDRVSASSSKNKSDNDGVYKKPVIKKEII